MDENQNNRENLGLCPQCGAQLKSGVNFCGKCGFKVRGNKNSQPEKKIGFFDEKGENGDSKSQINLAGQTFKDISEVMPQEKEPFTPFQSNETQQMNNSAIQKTNLNTMEEEVFAPIKQGNQPINDPFASELNQAITTSINPISNPTVKKQESKKESQMEFKDSNAPFESLTGNFKTHDMDNQKSELAFSNQEENLNKVSPPKGSGGETKYCNRCGTQLKINSKFCSACGAEINYTLEADISKETNPKSFQESFDLNPTPVRKSKAGKAAAKEKMNVFKSLISMVPEEEEEVSPFASDLPNWSIEPPVIPVQRKRRK